MTPELMRQFTIEHSYEPQKCVRPKQQPPPPPLPQRTVMRRQMGMEMMFTGDKMGGYGIVADTGGSMCQNDRDMVAMEVPALKLDDFQNISFGSVHGGGGGGGGGGGDRLLEGGSYGKGIEWLDIMSDLQPCESTKSSALPVVVDAWQDDFSLPRNLCIRSDPAKEVGASQPWRVCYDVIPLQSLQVPEEDYEMPNDLHLLQQIGQIQEQQQQKQQHFQQGATEPTRAEIREHPKLEVDAGERETGVDESDHYFGGDCDHGVQLVHLLLECAEAMDGGHSIVGAILRQLRDLSSPYGDPMQRVAAYFCDALMCRLAKLNGEVDASVSLGHVEDSMEMSLVANLALNEACPYSKFAHLTANQAILEAVGDATHVHIIDFGIMQGVQWAALLQAVAARPGGKPLPKIRITGISTPKLGYDTPPHLLSTGKRLRAFAAFLNIELQFCPIVAQLEEVDLGMLHVDPTEKVAVNFMLQLYKLLGNVSNSLQPLLHLVNSLKPAVVTLTEYDVSLNGPAFQPRFVDALHFYCAIFDSLDATMPRDAQDRLNVESMFLAKEIENIVACEGCECKERHECSEQWCNIMQASGFHNAPLSHYTNSQAQQLLWQYCDNFRLQPVSGCLSLGWQDRPLITVSAWHCT